MNPIHEASRQLEWTASRAWSALEETHYDGWVLRFADGYTKRANSVNPHFGSSLPLDEKIVHCETAYGDRDLPTIFRLTPFSQPEALDAVLAQCGYDKIDPSLVLRADLPEEWRLESPSVSHVSSDQWVAAFDELRGLEDIRRTAHRKIVEASTGEKCYALLSLDDVPYACGLGVLVDSTVCLFDLFTAKSHRRQGHGSAIVSAILHWASAHGARTGLLQVECENVPARCLYEHFGFEMAYPYWYRLKRNR